MTLSMEDLKELREMIRRIKIWFELYSCNYKKNNKCNKRYCAYCNKGDCKKTTQWKYAKRTPTNYIKRIINKMKGYHNHE